MSEQITIPKWFWITATLALVWNLLGVMAFAGQMMMTPDMLAQMPQAEQDLIVATPSWVNIAFGIAVLGGAVGCLLLLLKKSIAQPLLIFSLIGVIAQMSYAFFISNSFEVYGPGGMIMPVMVIIIAIGLVFFANSAKNKQWLS
jgi:hypothetical protein